MNTKNIATVEPEILSDKSVVYNVVQNGETVAHPPSEAQAIAICDQINSGEEFSPGPWRYKFLGGAYAHTVLGRPHPIDGGDYAHIGQFSRKEDAILAAAAPELLAALEWILKCPDLNLDELDRQTVGAIELANTALAKARGEGQGVTS